MEQDTIYDLYSELLSKNKIISANVPTRYILKLEPSYRDNKFFLDEEMSFHETYLRSQLFLDRIKKNPLYIGNIPQGFFSSDDLWNLLNENPLFILCLNELDITKEMYAYAVLKEPRLLGLLSNLHQNLEIVEKVIAKNPLALQYVHEDLKKYYICVEALRGNWRAIEFIPDDLIDTNIRTIVKNNADDFYLDYIGWKKEEDDIDVYTQQLIRFPLKSTDYMIRNDFNVSEEHLDGIIGLMESVSEHHPVNFFKNCSPSVLLANNPQNGLSYMLRKRPEWIRHMNPAMINENILTIALENGFLPDLLDIQWTSSFISLIYQYQPKFITKIPREKIPFIGIDRVKALILTSIDEGWINEIPHYFFTKNVIELTGIKDKPLDLKIASEEEQEQFKERLAFKELLVGHRPSFAAVLAEAQTIEPDELSQLDASIDELLLIQKSYADDQIEALLNNRIEHYVVLMDHQKTLERTISFLQIYPEYVYLTPKMILSDKAKMNLILGQCPNIASHLQYDDLIEII